MDRRALFQFVAALFGIPLGAAEDSSMEPAALPLDLAPAPGGGGPLPPSWLEEWLRLPMQPLIRPADLADCRDERVRNLAETILSHPAGGVPLVFHYDGGSDPGSLRSVLPVLLFRKFDPDLPASERTAEAASRPIYLLAHCQVRRAPRTFRLDRMGPVGAPWHFN